MENKYNFSDPNDDYTPSCIGINDYDCSNTPATGCDRCDDCQAFVDHLEKLEKIEKYFGVQKYGEVNGVNIRIADHAGNSWHSENQSWANHTDVSFIFLEPNKSYNARGDYGMREYDLTNCTYERAIEFIENKIAEIKLEKGVEVNE